MTNEKNTEKTNLQEIPQQELCEHIEDDDFFLAYGNPVVVKTESGKKVLAIAWPLAERLMRAAGREDEVDNIIKQASEIEADREPEPKDKKTKCIRIDGVIEVQEDLSLDEFLNSFIAFIESRGWYFGGKTSDESEDEYE